MSTFGCHHTIIGIAGTYLLIVIHANRTFDVILGGTWPGFKTVTRKPRNLAGLVKNLKIQIMVKIEI